MNNSINLYLQTEYSLLSSLIRIKTLPNLLKELDYDCCAICDDEMYGVFKFYNECLNNNIKPIIGLKITFKYDNFDSSLLLYAMNNVGYGNLLKICSIKNLDKDNFNINSLIGLTYGVLCVIPSFENEVIKYYVNNSFDKAKQVLNNYKQLFSDLYLGIDLQTNSSYKYINEFIKFSNNNNVKCVAINKTAYYLIIVHSY